MNGVSGLAESAFVCVSVKEEDGGGHDEVVGEAVGEVEACLESGLDDWMPEAVGAFGSEHPLAEVPGGVNPDWHGEAAGGESGDAEEQGAYAGSEDGVKPGEAADAVLESEDEGDDELGGPGSEGAVEAEERIAAEGEFFAGGQDEVEEQGGGGWDEALLRGADPVDVSDDAQWDGLNGYHGEADEEAQGEAGWAVGAGHCADVGEAEALPADEEEG